MSTSISTTHQRLFEQQTVNSIARQFASTVPIDSLDMNLSSVYNHETDLFVDKFGTVMQLENAKINPYEEKVTADLNAMRKKYIQHPLVIGGLTKKHSPHSVKLICNGQHTPITNPGYSRQPVDGNIFNY